MDQTLGFIDLLLLVVALSIFVGIPVYLYETGRISREEIRTVLAVELFLLALAQVVLSILLTV